MDIVGDPESCERENESLQQDRTLDEVLYSIAHGTRKHWLTSAGVPRRASDAEAVDPAGRVGCVRGRVRRAGGRSVRAGTRWDRRCPCPAPLTYVGPTWPGFEPASVVIVVVNVEVTIFVIIEVNTGEPFGRPVGGSGGDDEIILVSRYCDFFPERPECQQPTTTAPAPSTTAPAPAPPTTVDTSWLIDSRWATTIVFEADEFGDGDVNTGGVDPAARRER